MNDDPQPQTVALPQPQRAGDWKAILRDLGVRHGASRRMGQKLPRRSRRCWPKTSHRRCPRRRDGDQVGRGPRYPDRRTRRGGRPGGAHRRGRTRQAPRAVPPDGNAVVPQVTVIQQDILRVLPDDLVGGTPYVSSWRTCPSSLRPVRTSSKRHPPQQITRRLRRLSSER